MKIIREKYLDDNEEFYDYSTGVISNANDVFSIKKTGMSYYDDLLPSSSQADYMRKNKNLEGRIEYLTPRQYFDICAKDIFNVPVNNLIQSREVDSETLNKIKTVILKYKRQLPVTFINYAKKTQEGLHRMLAVAQLYGWNIKYPVLIIDYYDKELQTQLDRQREYKEKREDVYTAILKSLQYSYQNLEEFFDELQYQLNRRLNDDENIDVKFTHQLINNTVSITVDDVNFNIQLDEINFDNTLDN